MRTFAVKQLFSSAKIQYFFKIECENNIKKLHIGIKVRIIHYLCRKNKILWILIV